VSSPTVQAHIYYVPGPYTVTVTAFHANGGSRGVSAAITVGGVDRTVFADGFETGDVSAWSSVTP